MKAKYEDIVRKKGNHSFLAYQFSVPRFEFNWHYHPEFELTLILRGSGKRLVGDSFEDFKDGDLVLIGPHIPHTWVAGSVPRAKQSAVVIQFSESFIEPLIKYPECPTIAKLLTLAERGLYFPVTGNELLLEQIQQLDHKAGIERITGLYTILDALSGRKFIPLTSKYFKPNTGRENENRINAVCQYIEKEASGSLTIRKAAELIHLSESAFCKFFKRQTGKTFSDYVNHIRVSDACRLLMESDKLIGDIAHESGFESLTYFNRTFLKKKGVRPKDFRKHFLLAKNHPNRH